MLTPSANNASVVLRKSATGLQLYTLGSGDSLSGWDTESVQVFIQPNEPWTSQFAAAPPSARMQPSAVDDPAPLLPAPGSDRAAVDADVIESDVVVAIVVRRIAAFYVISAVLLSFVVTLVGFLSCGLDPDRIEARLTILVTLLLAEVGEKVEEKGGVRRLDTGNATASAACGTAGRDDRGAESAPLCAVCLQKTTLPPPPHPPPLSTGRPPNRGRRIAASLLVRRPHPPTGAGQLRRVHRFVYSVDSRLLLEKHELGSRFLCRHAPRARRARRPGGRAAGGGGGGQERQRDQAAVGRRGAGVCARPVEREPAASVDGRPV